MNQYLTFGGVENLNPGVGGVQSRVLPHRFTMSLMGIRPSNATGNNPGAYSGKGQTMDEDEMDGLGGSPILVWVGVAILLVGLAFVRQQQESLQVNLLGLNLFNLLVITLTAILGITLFKVVFLRFPIPGVTQLVAAV